MSKAAMLSFIRELPSTRAFLPKKRGAGRMVAQSRFPCLLPECSAVYFILDKDGSVLYIGATKNLYKRWQAHHYRSRLENKPNIRISWVKVAPANLMTVEAQFLRKLSPSLSHNKQRYPSNHLT